MRNIVRLLSEGSFKRVVQVISCAVVLWAAPQGHAMAAGVENHRCPLSECDLLANGTYTGVLIGRLDSVLSEEQSSQLLRAAQAQGRWTELPTENQQFMQRIQPVGMRVPDGAGGSLRVISLMSMEESQAMPLRKGDLVRFRPHGSTTGTAANPAPSDSVALAYWKAVGCVTALCRADDKDCQAPYVEGAWRFTDGQPIEPHTATPLTRGQRIDPLTYFPQANRSP
ncbi:hypothetical protein [Ottowia thiooxydans]|uniref:Uncharacterized protein n=1 Tax=Ottowia thiooxydans TaxID=219182 RepID=A0ABV2Q7E4_9BURK